MKIMLQTNAQEAHSQENCWPKASNGPQNEAAIPYGVVETGHRVRYAKGPSASQLHRGAIHVERFEGDS